MVLLTTQMFMVYILLFPYAVEKNFAKTTKNSVMCAFFVSLISYFVYTKTVENSTDLIMVNLHFLNMTVSIQIEEYAVFFTPVALYVTWSIMDFSLWYMETDQNIEKFFWLLSVFLLSMLLLIHAKNLFILFVGWEAVGLISFLLIGWYYSRNDAATAALQAMIYNRLGDMGYMIALSWLILNFHVILLAGPLPTAIVIGFIIAAASKSAQFGMHPWLASAMEGPTPVSALLHSSTMVVAGVFLLTRLYPSIVNSPVPSTVCLCLGAITTLATSILACMQNDMKKIIAYSTSSQLGLMMVAIGLNMPHLAFFHICCHAFAKAMLFLSAGYLIHSTGGNQDIRKLGGLQKAYPVPTACITIGSFSLMGFPFLAGYYSKDAIIEAATSSYVNSAALLITITALAFTAMYSMRMINYASMLHPRSSALTLRDTPPKVRKALIRLAVGSIIMGALFYYLLPPAPAVHTMSSDMKFIALFVTLMSFMYANKLAMTYWNKPPLPTPPRSMDPADYTDLLHRPTTDITLNSAGDLLGHLIEEILAKKVGPTPAQNSMKPPLQKVKISQSGLIKMYMALFFITIIFCLIAVKIWLMIT